MYSYVDKSISLPKYPWQKREYKNDTLVSQKWKFENKAHELLGYRSFLPVPMWELQVNKHELRYLFDHKISDQGVFPAAGYVEMVLLYYSQLYGHSKITIKNMNIRKPIFLPTDEDTLNVRFSFNIENGTFDIYSQPRLDDQWQHHVQGEISSIRGYSKTPLIPVQNFQNNTQGVIPKKEFYLGFEKLGFQYGPFFQLVEQCIITENENSISRKTCYT